LKADFPSLPLNNIKAALALNPIKHSSSPCCDIFRAAVAGSRLLVPVN